MAPGPETSTADQSVDRWARIGIALVASCALIAMASWIKTDLTRNDFERFDDLRLSFLFFALCAGLAAAYLAAYSQPGAVRLSTVAWVSATAMVLLWATFPVGSKDIFGYAFYGRILGRYHQNPYLSAPADFPDDAWSPFVQARWRNAPMAYGPLFVWQSAPIDWLAGASVWTAVWLHKTLGVAWLVLGLWLGARVLRGTADPPRSRLLVLLAWNPLLLFEAAGNGHNDVAMMTLLLAGLWSWRAKRPDLALTFLALSFWFKWYGLLFVPPFVLATFETYGTRCTLRSAACAGAVVALVGLLTFLSLPGSMGPMFSALLHPSALAGIFPNELSPPLSLIFGSLRAAGLFETDRGQQLFDGIRISLFGIAVGAILIRQWRAASPFPALIESCCLLGSAFFLLLVTMLLPWHLLTIIAAATVRGREPWLAWAATLTVLGLASYFLTFPVAALGAAGSAAALWVLRRLGTSHRRPASGAGMPT